MSGCGSRSRGPAHATPAPSGPDSPSGRAGTRSPTRPAPARNASSADGVGRLPTSSRSLVTRPVTPASLAHRVDSRQRRSSRVGRRSAMVRPAGEPFGRPLRVPGQEPRAKDVAMTHSTQAASTIDHGSRTGGGAVGALRAVQVTAVLAVLNLVVQYVTAGQILPRGGPAIGVHATGAIVLHVVTGLLALAAILYARAQRGPWWPPVVAVLVFVCTFVQAYFGDEGNLKVHVPGALVLTVGIVWLTAWSFTRAVRR